MSSIRYTLEDIQKKREAAGLGTLSMGICALSGELVSSTPIPGSRHGDERHGTTEYGGYLVGEGMTREVALYLGNLHNHFPAIAEAAARAERLTDEDGDAAYLAAIQKIAESHGWNILEGPLGEWIDKHLEPAPHPAKKVTEPWECPNCKQLNSGWAKTCGRCGTEEASHA